MNDKALKALARTTDDIVHDLYVGLRKAILREAKRAVPEFNLTEATLNAACEDVRLVSDYDEENIQLMAGASILTERPRLLPTYRIGVHFNDNHGPQPTYLGIPILRIDVVLDSLKTAGECYINVQYSTNIGIKTHDVPMFGKRVPQAFIDYNVDADSVDEESFDDVFPRVRDEYRFRGHADPNIQLQEAQTEMMTFNGTAIQEAKAKYLKKKTKTKRKTTKKK